MLTISELRKQAWLDYLRAERATGRTRCRGVRHR
jgi:hypothetical protein